mmetsp:Transcript_5293/g.11496  ORF Transcript_5293/g.11496 Transcript_5293/m.11496 type:complete len:625 (+) Transcript_5293:213-2087(+)
MHPMTYVAAGLAVATSQASDAMDGEPRLWTVFCAECTNNFDYKSLGVFWSHKLSGMPGGVTRLLACDETQLASYRGLDLGNTFVHKNYAHITQRREGHSNGKLPFGARETDGSPSYNKPGSIMHWVHESEEAKHVDYVLYIDADMLLRKPMDPIAMGVRPGVVVSEHVGYLDEGIRNGLPEQFLPAEAVQMVGADYRNHNKQGPKRHSAGGWYHFFYIEDIRKIARRWFYWCREMRLNPQKYWRMIDPATGQPSGVDHDIKTGDAYVTHGQAPWISEMYGYVFAAAEAGLLHILTSGVVVYPDDVGASSPQEAHIIHYGLHCAVGSFRFTKYTFGGFDAVGCTGKLFGDPPAPAFLERLCAETVLTLNDAMCDFYNRAQSEHGCGLDPQIQCPAWEMFGKAQCGDRDSHCHEWASAGECKANPGFMMGSCPASCGKCDELPDTMRIPAWAKGLRLDLGDDHRAGGSHADADAPALRPAHSASRALSDAKSARLVRPEPSDPEKRTGRAAKPDDEKSEGAEHERRPSRLRGRADRAAATEDREPKLKSRIEDNAQHRGDAEAGRKDEKERAIRDSSRANGALQAEGLSSIRALFYFVWALVLFICTCVIWQRFCRRRSKPDLRNV